MTRGMLDATDMERISQELPDLSNLQQIASFSSPDSISISFPYKSNIPVASVCLREAVDTLAEATYALHEVFAHRIWYREKKDPPEEMTAAFFERYYADDAALRLYSAGEHLANGIIMMLEITDEDLKPPKVKGKQGKERSSLQSVVGNYLRRQKVSHPITEAVKNLAESKEWIAMVGPNGYRHRLVHGPLPTVKQMGNVYERKIRWETLPNGKHRLTLRNRGDRPEYSVEELVEFIQPAMFRFTDTLTSVSKFYIDLLRSWGLSLTFDRTSSTINVKMS